MNFKRRSLGIAALVAVVFGTGVSAISAQEYSWRMQSFWAAGSTNQQAFVRFAENVEAMSGGRVEIEVHAGGSIVPPGEMLDAVKAGILDGMNGTGAYFVGKDPGFTLIADINAGYETPEQFTAWFWVGGGVELAREIYA